MLKGKYGTRFSVCVFAMKLLKIANKKQEITF